MTWGTLNILCCFIPIMLFLAFLKFLRTARFKGILGETFVKVTVWFFLPRRIYRPLHNVTLPTRDGSTTQIDHIFISRFGIFVVETKNMKGLIIGEERQKQWTQQFSSTSFTFQNPLHQNYKHVKALEDTLDVPPKVIHSVLVFVGKSTFKSPMPPNVTQRSGYFRYIKSFRTPVLSEAQAEKARERIQSLRLAPTRKTDRRHVQQLQKRFSAKTERIICPNCGEAMVLRTAKKGRNSGKQFWGCSAYPECRAVQNIH